MIFVARAREFCPNSGVPAHMFNPFKKKRFEIDDFAKLVITEPKKAGMAESLEYDPKSFVIRRGNERSYLVNLFNDSVAPSAAAARG